jgi:hypothetical protein
MGKKLVAAALFTLIFLAFGTEIAPDSPLFWLASSAVGYQVIRFGLVLILLLQLGSDPPRHRTFRIISAWVAGVTSLWVLRATYANYMALLDTLSLLGSVVAIGLTALERTSPDSSPVSSKAPKHSRRVAAA